MYPVANRKGLLPVFLLHRCSYEAKNAPRGVHSREWKMSRATALGTVVRKQTTILASFRDRTIAQVQIEGEQIETA